MLAWRKVGGSSRRLASRAAFWLAIAPKAALALEIALESSFAAFGDRRAEPAGADEEAGEEMFVGVEFVDEGAGAVEADAEVFEGAVGVLAAAGVDRRVALDELAEAAAHRGREGVEELVDVDRGRGRGEAERGVLRPSAGLLFGPGLIET